MVVTKYPKDRIRARVMITNAAEGVTQDYGISLEFKDAAGKNYHFVVTASVGAEWHGTIATRAAGVPVAKTKLHIVKGTSISRTYIATVPEGAAEFAEGKIEGRVTIYESDAADASEIVTTGWVHAYNYAKKKYHLSLSVTWE